MFKQKVITFVVFFISLLYLISYFEISPLVVYEEIDFSSLEDNTKISIMGVPENIRIFKEYSSFEIYSIEVRISNIREKTNSSLAVTGYKKSYQNRSWLQATEIKYDS